MKGLRALLSRIMGSKKQRTTSGGAVPAKAPVASHGVGFPGFVHRTPSAAPQPINTVPRAAHPPGIPDIENGAPIAPPKSKRQLKRERKAAKKAEKQAEKVKDETTLEVLREAAREAELAKPAPELKRKKGKKTELRFSPLAYVKLLWLRDRGSTEISVFGLSRLDDLLYVEDVRLVKQKAGGASFEFDDEALSEYLYDMLQEGWQPVECMRIWIHTHPGGTSPSSLDKETFDKTTKEADWGIMCIVGKDGEMTARLRISAGNHQLSHELQLTPVVDWSGPFKGVSQEDVNAWDKEYKTLVEKEYCSNYTVSSSKSVRPERVVSGGGTYTPYSGYGCNGYDYDDHYYYKSGHEPSRWQDDGDPDMPRLPDGDPPTMADRGAPDDPNTYGIFEKPQMIHQITEDLQFGVAIVWTDEYWIQYDINEQLLAEPGHEIDELLDICLLDPLLWGEALWDVDDKGNPIVRRLSVWIDEDKGFREFEPDTSWAEPFSGSKLDIEEDDKQDNGGNADETQEMEAAKEAAPKKKAEEKPVVVKETLH